MPMPVINKSLVACACLLGGLLFFQSEARAERAIVQVTPEEFKRLGYQDKDEFMSSYAKCVDTSKNMKKTKVCNDDECVKKSKDWLNNNCEKHSTAMFYLTSLKPPQYPVSGIFDNSEKANYIRLYTASCQDGYKSMNNGGDVAIAKTICECAANQSLDLIEYSDYKGFESVNASREVAERVKNRAAYARFICENLPFVWRTQPADVGSSGGVRVADVAAAGKGYPPDVKLTALFDQLKGQGTGLYNSLLAKLAADSKDNSCGNNDACIGANQTLGDIYRDVLYVAYAIQLYKSADECNRPVAKNKLNDFIKAALLSVEPNMKYLRGIVVGNKGDRTNLTLLAKAFGDAEGCQNTLANISRELERK